MSIQFLLSAIHQFGKLQIGLARVRLDSRTKFLLLSAIGLFILANFAAKAVTLNVFAASSLTESLKSIGSAYEKQSGDKLVFNWGGSSTLARQIEEGAPADIFVSADEEKMDRLQNKDLIETKTRRSRLSNSLVIIVPAKDGAAITSPRDLAGPKIKRIALGDPRAVPIGIYAKEYFERLGLWPQIQTKVVATENARAALSAVESGDADASIVYKTDALISKRVKISYRIPAAEAPRISYPMAMVKRAKQPKAAMRFLNYLESEEAGKLFEKYGFVLAGASGAQ